jgi:hypothetical protein
MTRPSSAGGATVFAGIDRWECPDEQTMQSLFDWTNLWWTGFYLGSHYNYTGKYDMLRRIGWGILPIFWARQPAGYCKGIKKDLEKNNPRRAARFNLAMCKAAQEVNGSDDEAFDDGIEAGQQAASFARHAGIPIGSIVYLDCEIPHGDTRWVSYYAGWIRGLTTDGYLPGCYCSFFGSFPTWLRFELQKRPGGRFPREKLPPAIWVFNVQSRGKTFKTPFSEDHPRGGSPEAAVWQYAHNGNLEWIDRSDPARPVDMRLPTVDLNTSIFRDPSQGALSNIGYLKKEMIRGSRLRPEFAHSSDLRPQYSHSGDLKPAFQNSGQFTPEFKRLHGL